MSEKSANKLKILNTVKETRKLFAKCSGILFVYSLIFAAFEDYIFLPVSRKLWSLSLMTVKEGYISDQNITAVFTHPCVLLAGLFAIMGYCVLCLWETAGITMILEYSYNDKPVKFASVIVESIKQIKHCFHPKNWIIFVYLLIVQPLVNSDYAGQMLSDITIPEFIMDYITARSVMSVLLIIIMTIAVVFFVRYLYIPMIMILEKKNFREAAKKSVGYLKGKFISSYFKIAIASIIGSILFNTVPYIIQAVVEEIMIEIYKSNEFANSIGEFVFSNAGTNVLDSLVKCFMKLFVSAMLIVTYHFFESHSGNESHVNLPEKCIKTKGRIFKFKKFVYFVYAINYIALIVLFITFTVAAENNPLVVANIINPTKIAAHKGYSSIAPENTMPAFEKAANCDAVDFIELDVRETKDGIPVVIHDESIKSATGKDISIYDLTFDELKKYNAIYSFSDAEFADTKFSSLDEVLSEYSEKIDFIIEIKASKKTPDLPKKIVNLMEKYGITQTSVIHSGNYDSLKTVKEINPEIKCGFIIAVSTGGYEDLPYADFFSVEHTYLSENVINRVHKRNKEVYVWTVNEESSFDQVRGMDVDVLITDYPEDAYNGIHKYDADLMDKLKDRLEKLDFDNLEDINNGPVNHEGTGD